MTQFPENVTQFPKNMTRFSRMLPGFPKLWPGFLKRGFQAHCQETKSHFRKLVHTFRNLDHLLEFPVLIILKLIIWETSGHFWGEIPHSADIVSITICPRVNIHHAINQKQFILLHILVLSASTCLHILFAKWTVRIPKPILIKLFCKSKQHTKICSDCRRALLNNRSFKSLISYMQARANG